MKTLPEKFLFLLEKAKLTSFDPTQVPKGQGLKKLTSKLLNRQKFEWDNKTVELDFDEAMELFYFQMSCGGREGVFRFRNPYHEFLQPKESSRIFTRQLIPKGSTSIPCDGFTPNIIDAFKIGTFTNFATHSKAYSIGNSPNANGLGQSTVEIYPPTFYSIPDNTELTYGDNMFFQVGLNTDIVELDLDAGSAGYIPVIIDCSEKEI